MTSKLTITDERIEKIAVCLATESHSLNLEMLTCLRELQERRKADSEPVYQCEFTHADASGELQWHWEDVNEAFYEQYGSGPRGQRRILYSVPQPAPQPGPVMESEPVAEVLSSRPGNDTSTIDRALPVGTQLYRHAQQPVVPPMQHWEELCREYPDMSIGDAIIRAAWWNHCRAAMLQAGNSPAHSGLCPEQGSAPPAQDGCSPAQNQGWIPVGERMPENDGAYLCWDKRYVTTYAFIFGAWQANQFIAKNITHWMPLPAGPQEVQGE